MSQDNNLTVLKTSEVRVIKSTLFAPACQQRQESVIKF